MDECEAPIRDYCAGRKTVKSAGEVYVEVIARGDPGALAKLDKKADAGPSHQKKSAAKAMLSRAANAKKGATRGRRSKSK